MPIHTSILVSFNKKHQKTEPFTRKGGFFLKYFYGKDGVSNMKLPNGVSGFYNSKANEPPLIDGKLFKQLCYHLTVSNGGKVLDSNLSHSSANFYKVQVEMFDFVFYILINKHYPYLAFAAAVDFGDIQFVDIPALSKQFSHYYHVLDTIELSVFIEGKHKSELNRAELQQISYWKPENVGQILFNFWD